MDELNKAGLLEGASELSEPRGLTPLEAAIITLLAQAQTTGSGSFTEADCVDLIKGHYSFVRVDLPIEVPEVIASLAPEFIKAAQHGHKGVALATLDMTEDKLDGISLRSRSIASALKARAGRILSPFSGTVEPIRSSLGRDWYLLDSQGKLCIAGQIGAPMSDVNLETVWILPQTRAVLYVGLGLGIDAIIDDIAKLYWRCLSNQDGLSLYLSRENDPAGRSIAMADFWCPHLAHNFWNVQTGWANVFSLSEGARPDRYITFQNQDFFGKLPDLFRHEIPNPAAVAIVGSDDEIFRMMLSENLLLFGVKDEFFTKSFTDRVLLCARKSASPDLADEIRALRGAAYPLIVTTVRLDNRAWIEQRAGMPALFRQLRQAYPRCGLVIDGLSSDTIKGWTTEWMSLEQELEFARAVRAELPEDMPVKLGVGRKFVDSMLLADAADLFIAPTGSGMTLYKWLSNLPGLAFSNRSVLSESSPHRGPLRVWHDPRFRRDLVHTEHLAAELVEDGDVARGHVSRANFHLDWNHLFAACLPIIQGLPNPRRGCVAVEG